ncbi:MAG: NAD(P)/FAD-dependent oxidoreductase [Deltaproteobacteria bacterium]|nr:NAD(P)/FAD-dependent oxidoreductase [Deltaproteobacteria bacterium]
MEGYDVVVIGAGNGGLMAAATLVQKGLNVLLLERHNIPGGCATSFCRGRFEFEVALHQLSGMGTPEKAGPLRSLLDGIGVMDKLEFVPMSDLYRVTLPGKLDITLRPDWSEIISELQRHFPNEKEGIEKYFDLIRKYFTEVIGAFYLNDPETNREKYPLYFRYALKSTQEVLDQYFKDPLLKFVVSPYWSYMGLPPRLMSFNDMAAMIFGFCEFKPYHLRGGSQALSNAIADVIIARGGKIRFNCGAKKIIVEDGSIKGVVTEDGEEIPATCVISNASKVVTYVELIDHKHVPDAVFKELRQCSLSQSAFTLYIGLDCEPKEVGLTESTNFIFGGTDMDSAYERMKTIEIGDEDFVMLTCYDLIDPSFSPEGACQVALVTLKYGETWLSVPPAQYVREKYRIADSMLHVAEKVFPDLRKHIEEIEIATPLTHMRYLGHPRGAIYGFDHYVKDSTLFVPNQPHIKGLYSAGGWVGFNGFQPTLESGVKAAKALLRELRA